MSQQMSFTIMYNVLKRWLTVEFQRALTSWRMNAMVARWLLNHTTLCPSLSVAGMVWVLLQTSTPLDCDSSLTQKRRRRCAQG